MSRNTESTGVRTHDGAAAAALVAGGIGIFIIGLLTSLVETSGGLKSALIWWDSAGPLSGKTGVGVIVWLVAWLGLWFAWKGKNPNLRMAFTVMIVWSSLAYCSPSRRFSPASSRIGLASHE
jgi:hypothetical protein